MLYEVHITFEPNTEIHAERIERHSFLNPKWKFSKIDGDPALGPGIKYYLTSHFSTAMSAYTAMEAAADEVGGAIRKKIEHIIHDTKSGHSIFGAFDNG